MNIDLNGRTALVCGSTQGIGKAIAIQFAKSGARVILLARNEEKLKTVLSTLPGKTQEPHQYLLADFSDTAGLAEVCNELSKIRIDILVNNTGGPDAGKAMDATPLQFISAFNAHLINNHQLMLSVLPGMKSRSFGRIINIISTSVKAPLPNLGVSNTIRAAVGNWSKTLASELATFGITVNNILPGATETERLNQIIENRSGKQNISKMEVETAMLEEIPMKRFGKPEEPAFAATFLASEYAAYITGTNIVVDGGRTPCL